MTKKEQKKQDKLEKKRQREEELDECDDDVKSGGIKDFIIAFVAIGVFIAFLIFFIVVV